MEGDVAVDAGNLLLEALHLPQLIWRVTLLTCPLLSQASHLLLQPTILCSEVLNVGLELLILHHYSSFLFNLSL